MHLDIISYSYPSVRWSTPESGTIQSLQHLSSKNPPVTTEKSRKGNNERAKEFHQEIVLIIHLKFKNTMMIHVSKTSWNISPYLVIRLIDRPGVLRTMNAKKDWWILKLLNQMSLCIPPRPVHPPSVPQHRPWLAMHHEPHGCCRCLGTNGNTEFQDETVDKR